MLPEGLLSLENVAINPDAPSKKRVLELAANLLGKNHEQAEAIFERLLERERLGSTGLAGGVALPHARMAGVATTQGAFLRLGQAVDFDSLDGEPVDLVFALLVPEEATKEHLQLLAHLARLFDQTRLREQLRQTDSAATALALLNGEPGDAP